MCAGIGIHAYVKNAAKGKKFCITLNWGTYKRIWKFIVTVYFLKVENISTDAYGTVKLGDFGVSAGMFDTGDRERITKKHIC
jgi:hypothetical protein